MENFEQLHSQTIESQNKELIENARKNFNKPPVNKNWITILWVIVMVIVTIASIIGIYYAIKPIPNEENNTINLTVNGEDNEKNQTELSKLKFPADKVDYSLYVCNDKQSEFNIYFRFTAVTFVEGVMEENILAFFMEPDMQDNFYYDESQDTWYYMGYLEIEEKVNICSQVKIKDSAGNSFAGKSVSFALVVEAVQANADYLWLDASQEWLELMGLN